ncbi:MAG: hypothetical protein LBQ27_06440 [Clostridiales bacterium]|nr:hypothetical protein [Clostridiales bacterium]
MQKQRNLYSKTTDDAKNYDSALSSLNSVMTSIAKGKGAAYLTTLEKLGVSTTDTAGKTKSAAEVYGEVESNSKITRQGIATALGVKSKTVEYYISILKKEGRLERKGFDKTGYWTVLK